jgi:hypothetical protein
MKQILAYFIFSLFFVSCSPPRPDLTPQKPGEPKDCVGGGCKPNFSVTIYKDGHVTAENIDTMLPDPLSKPPSGDVSLLDWLAGILSPGSLVDKPIDGGAAGGSSTTGNGPGTGSAGQGGDGTVVGGDGQSTDTGNTDPCMADPTNCQESDEVRETNFENSELGKLLSGTWKGINYGFGEMSGSNRKKRKEAQALNRRYAEMRDLEAQVNGLVDSINTGSNTVMATVEDLSNAEKFNLTGDTFRDIVKCCG